LNKLQKITVPLYIEGIKSMYENVKKNNKSKKHLLKEFQQSMVDVSRWSQEIIKNEHMRFKRQSSLLDKLIKLIFDLDIILKKELCKNAEDFIPQPWDFVHQCYLNIARALWKQPFLVYDVNVDKLTIQQNNLKTEKIISSCIQDTFTQYLPLDIEHDDVSNIDYIKPEEESIDEQQIDNTIYGDNNEDVGNDLPEPFMTSCNDTFKSRSFASQLNTLDHTAPSNSDLPSHEEEEVHTYHESLNDNDYDNEKTINIDDVDESIHHDEDYNNKTININDVDESIDDEDYNNKTININDVNELIEDDEDYNDIDELIEYEDDDDDNVEDNMSYNELSDEEDDYERESFHSEDVGDIESVKSDEIFISRIQRNEPQEEEQLYHQERRFDITTEPDYDVQPKPEEIKQVFIGSKSEMDEFMGSKKRNTIYHQNITSPPMSPKNIKIVNIDDNKTKLSSRKEALLTIKKKVKSSISKDRERFGDRIQVERKNMSFF
jgi:hypothetical protein